MTSDDAYIKLNGHNRLCIATHNMEAFKALRKTFTYENPIAKYAGFGDQFLYGISPIGQFKTGLFTDIYIEAKKHFPNVYVDQEIINLIQPINDYTRVEEASADLLPLPREGFSYRQVQANAIGKWLKFGRGVVELPTAAGKNILILGLAWNLKHLYKDINRILICVPTTQLVGQFVQEARDFGLGEDFISSYCTSQRTLLDSFCVVTNRQFIEGKTATAKLQQLIDADFDCICVDEAHTLAARGAKIAKLLDRKFKAKLRFGCTATIPPEIYNQWELWGIVGPLLYRESIKTLQDQGQISNLKINAVQFQFNKSEIFKSGIYDLTEEQVTLAAKFQNELKWFAEHAKLKSALANYLTKLSGNTLVLFDKLEYGRGLRDALSTMAGLDDIRVHYIDGQIAIADRDDIKAILESSSNNILLAQHQTFGTGINIKNLHNLVFAFYSKRSVKIIQAIGRSLRLHSSKDLAKVYDITSNLKYAQKHYKERVKVYKEAYGIEHIPTTIINIA
jgi:superfamily II DNA or RNA helicase